jgi:hypothetical protein
MAEFEFEELSGVILFQLASKPRESFAVGWFLKNSQRGLLQACSKLKEIKKIANTIFFIKYFLGSQALMFSKGGLDTFF